jgi:hypothetical protein
MKIQSNLLIVGIVLTTLTACIMPPSLFEQASWAPPSDYWASQGRFRQTPGETAMPPAQAPTDVTPQVLPGADAQQGAQALSAPEMEAPLYSWDGGVVNGAPQGRVATEQGLPRGVEAPPAGRMHIIELYQQVLDERDSLAEEVELLRSSLEQVTLALDAKTKEAGDLVDRVASLEAAHMELMNDNKAIAARLVQAQIRRLEAEKMLLETRIEVERARTEEAALSATVLGRKAAGGERLLGNGGRVRE